MCDLTLQTLLIIFPLLFLPAICSYTMQGKNLVCKNLLKYLTRDSAVQIATITQRPSPVLYVYSGLQDHSILPPHPLSSSCSSLELWCNEFLLWAFNTFSPDSHTKQLPELQHPSSAWGQQLTSPINLQWLRSLPSDLHWLRSCISSGGTEAAAFRPAAARSAWTACTKVSLPHIKSDCSVPLCADWAYLSADEQVAIYKTLSPVLFGNSQPLISGWAGWHPEALYSCWAHSWSARGWAPHAIAKPIPFIRLEWSLGIAAVLQATTSSMFARIISPFFPLRGHRISEEKWPAVYTCSTFGSFSHLQHKRFAATRSPPPHELAAQSKTNTSRKEKAGDKINHTSLPFSWHSHFFYYPVARYSRENKSVL